ncbi:binding--dependent transport system inner membrane component family protein [Bordetella holmesii 30539]|uniref:Binding--dependent transport system inner membrane component family protein n=1 Tax=Bordetella holmesii 1058 TaxID=1247648 RepID=A0ABN0RZ39_9BORD|nr:binding--dependent transport system inner membrane component family protein [Bordetella holmesii 44057]EWM41045.1 binding--dependent transport system inner membrane component family protein [Bordetella holmesii 35009]EWM42641.1 binding--dependent transport system inner membrane component family protein [Bordetella holmesii 41130]EWM44935.1 binding--dependent transport system inner membrane component family protein [Bordetella holmesii 70147]EXF88261.1 binding--dependent transport system inne
MRGRGWLLASALIALAVLVPLASLAWWAMDADLGHWNHLAAYVLPQALSNTAQLLLGVGILVTVLGAGSAWLVAAYDFPSRNILVWALLLPLAVPTYIIAFAYLDLLHPIGPVQSVIRALLGYDSPRQFRLPDLRSLGGAIFVLGFVLYPYVYLSTRIMFMTQAASLIEAARSLGASRTGVFFRVALPLARPAIAVGVSLALLETLNDIGASEFLGVQTLTVSVYTTWITRSDLAGAAQIALTMLALVIALVLLERRGRRRQRYATTQRMRPMQPQRLRGLAALTACLLGWIPVILGFVAPALYLLAETYKRLHLVGGVSGQLLASLGNTLLVAASATVITVLCGLAVAWAARNLGSGAGPARACARIASLGYAVPDTVLAIGLLTPFAWVDQAAGRLLGWPGMLLMGTTGALVCAYTIRFLAISTGSVEAGLARIPPSLEQASRLLGETVGGTLRRVHLPLLRPALAAAALLVFVDTMKELPATLLLRPMNFDTLATWLYAEAARGTYEEGAVAALAIVLAGLAPVILLARSNLKMGH